MKKLFTIGLGSLFLATLIATPFSEASRDAYHSYLYNQHLKKNENRFSPSMRMTDPRRLIRNENRNGKRTVRNLRYPTGSKRNIYTRHTYKSSKYLRPSSLRILAFNKRTSDRNLRIRQISKVLNRFKTQETQNFSIQVPSDMKINGETSFINKGTGLRFSVKYIEKCSGISFTTCAIAAGKEANATTVRDKITNITRIERQLSKSDTVLKDIAIQTNTFTEAFEGVYLGKEIFISRYFAADGLGGMYVVEARTSKRNESRDLGVIKKTFDSFRIK